MCPKPNPFLHNTTLPLIFRSFPFHTLTMNTNLKWAAYQLRLLWVPIVSACGSESPPTSPLVLVRLSSPPLWVWTIVPCEGFLPPLASPAQRPGDKNNSKRVFLNTSRDCFCILNSICDRGEVNEALFTSAGSCSLLSFSFASSPDVLKKQSQCIS